jgi:hypothetical protein
MLSNYLRTFVRSFDAVQSGLLAESISRLVTNRAFIWTDVKTAVVMKSSVFWDITTCSPLKVSRCFRGTYRLHFQGRISRARYQREAGCKQVGSACHLPSCWYLARLILRPWRWRRYVPSKRLSTVNGLHFVTSQMTKLFITTAVRTLKSNTCKVPFL